MQTYKELLHQFHQGQESVVQDNCHVNYAQLLNQLKLSKEKRLSERKKVKFESSRLQTLRNDSPRHLILQKSLHTSRMTEAFDPYKQKWSLIELQAESLQKEINYIQSGFQKLRVEKKLLKEELQIINKKELQILQAFCESQNNIEELKTLIKEQKQTNEKDFQAYDKKISELTEKLSNINEENMLNAKHFDHLKTAKVQTKNNSLLGTILMWQSQESKIKKMPKKLYTKTQIQSMFRALFLICKLSELNYGNIIQHLIKMSSPTNSAKSKPKYSHKIFLNQKSEEIAINQLLIKLQAQLLTPNQCKFLSKTKIVEFYVTKGIFIQSDWQPTNLSSESLELIQKVVRHFQNLTSWFSRIEKRNLQLSQNFRSLLTIDQQLDKQIKSIQSSAVENSINYLQSREKEIEQIHQKLNFVCKVIFLFNINMYDLIRRFQNLNKFFDKIVKSTHRRTHRKTFVQISEDTEFLKKINKSLFKSPQCIIMGWNNVIKRIKTENTFIMTVEMFEQIPQNDMYFETVMKNDLLRIYAEPSMFDKEKSYIDNLKNTFDYVMNEESEIIQKLCLILKDLCMFSKNGLMECENNKIAKKEENKKVSVRQESETSKNLDPLIKLLQQANVKLDKFFAKDEVKEEDVEKPPESDMFCVQSNEFYRRDNFKLIEKLEKLDMKRKGLLPSVPFAINTSLEMQPFTRTVEEISLEKDTSRFGSTRNSYRKREPRLSHQMHSARHNVVSERREFENSRKKDLKNLLSNISNIASGSFHVNEENQKYRIRKRFNCQEEMLNTSTSRVWINRSHLESLSKRDKNK